MATLERRPLLANERIPVPLCIMWTFASGDVDADRLAASLEALVVDGGFSLLRGIVRRDCIVVEAATRQVAIRVDRPDLSLDILLDNVRLAHALLIAPLFEGAPVFEARIFQLADGVAVGLCASHALCDAHSLFSIIAAAWAAQYAGTPPPQPLFDTNVLTPPSQPTSATPAAQMRADEMYQEWPIVLSDPVWHPFFETPEEAAMAPPPPQNRLRGMGSDWDRLYLSDALVDRIVAAAGAVSRHPAVFALIWKALGVPSIFFPANVRENERRWSPPVPRNFVGNAFFLVSAVSTAMRGADVSLAELASIIRAAIDTQCTSEANQALLAVLEERVTQHLASSTEDILFVPGETMFGISSWAHAGAAPMFGGAKPRLFRTNPAPLGFGFLMSGPDVGFTDGLCFSAHEQYTSVVRAYLAKEFP
eukprot:m.310765 g.310765  ORF g.310765 m.310765 type:complete len:421 (-) comp25893_c0_seq1:66-1328(-)